MHVMLLRETNGLPELTDGLTALTAWVMRQTEGFFQGFRISA